MKKELLKDLIMSARGMIKADVVIKNCKVVNVFTKEIIDGDIAIVGEQIAGVGKYDGKVEIDAEGRYAVPGFIDSHIHIESSYVSPEELGRLLVPHGTSTIIADPHEIVNVMGIKGLDYMMKAAKNTKMDIKFMLPSCVPATPFEHAGAIVNADKMEEPMTREDVLGLGEFMNFPGIINGDDEVLEKLMIAKQSGKLIDGHCPGLSGKDLTAYACAGIHDDHECSTLDEMKERLSLGMYVMLREGSACHDLRKLVKGVTPENSRRCVLCSDDIQPKHILTKGHIENDLRKCIEEGIDPITAIQMATLNAAECFRLYDRGAVAPGYLANIALLDDLKEFHVNRVWMHGQLVAEEGKYLPTYEKQDISEVKNSVHLKDFSAEKLKMHLTNNHVHVIAIQPGGVVTKKETAIIPVENGEYVFSADLDIVKVAVVERHHMTGNVACGFLKGYGIKKGAIALSIAHDSHNIIVAGVNDEEMAFAVESLQKQNGGIVLVNNKEVIECMPMPIAGLMSDQPGEWVKQKVIDIHKKAYEELGVNKEVEPVMTLCFMSLPVIPEIKLTDMGLFDVQKFSFIPVECESHTMNK